MQSYSFKGYVHKVIEGNQYRRSFILCDVDESEQQNVKYPQYVMFNASAKKQSLIDLVNGFGVGDHVEVEFFPWAKEGTSKSTGNYYCISENNVSKIKVLKKAETKTVVDENNESEEDLPF